MEYPRYLSIENWLFRQIENDYDYNYSNCWPDNIVQSDFDAAYEEHELHEQVDAIERERNIRAIEREWQLERIAREAKRKNISLHLCFKFFKDYNVSNKEQTKFWYYYNEETKKLSYK